MPPPRRITDVAIDCAIHGLPEPPNGWRNHVPPEGLGQMFGAGSAQITLQALVALLRYGSRAEAVRKLKDYAARCIAEFMAAEPWSVIYGRAIVLCWLGVVVIAEQTGERELAEIFRGLLRRWAATSRLMEADVALPKRGKRNRRIERAVLHAGCRSWGHAQGPSGLSDLWAIAAGRREPARRGTKAYGKPGVDDNWGWLDRAPGVGIATLRGLGAEFPDGEDPLALLARMPRWGARTEMQLLGWEDGSRLWIMGDDEPEFDDEDENGNTPGLLVAGVLGREAIHLPAWPNPVDGKTRLRQTNCRGDVDGDPDRGWFLWHSHLGARRAAHPSGAPGFVSELPPYTAAPLHFHVAVPERSTAWQVLHPAGMRLA